MYVFVAVCGFHNTTFIIKMSINYRHVNLTICRRGNILKVIEYQLYRVQCPALNNSFDFLKIHFFVYYYRPHLFTWKKISNNNITVKDPLSRLSKYILTF